MEREIVLDTETTGLDPKQGHKIVEIGALEIYNKVPTGKTFHYYINPQRDMPLEAYKIHGISSDFLQDKPLFQDVAQDFLRFVGDSRLVIHNARFDIKFLNYELGLLNHPLFDLSLAVDTLMIARRKFPSSRVNLDALCKRFNIDNSDREFHGALKDAKLLSLVYLELMGGRQEAFFIDAKKNKEDSSLGLSSDSKQDSYSKAVVISPTQDELKLHQEFIARLKN